jgi:hypothetical protein
MRASIYSLLGRQPREAEMRRKVLSGGLIAACAGCLLAPVPAVAGTLDQQQPNPTGSTLQIQATQSVAQTFTAGLSGGLDRVDLHLGKGGAAGDLTAPLTVEIRNAAGVSPGATVLATASVPPTAVTTTAVFIPVTFTTPAPVVEGTRYAIVAYTSQPNTRFYTWSVNASNPYSAGASYFTPASPPGGAWTEFAGVDTTFKTYVVPGATGKRAAALKKCKKKKTKKKRKKCRKKAKKKPL